MSTVGDLYFPKGFRQVVAQALLYAGPAAACVVKNAEGRPTFAVEEPMH